MKVGAREKNFIFIGTGIIAILALYYALTMEQPGGEELTDTVEIKTKTLRNQRETLDLEGVYESRLQLYNARLLENKTRLLPGNTPNVAGAELLNTLTDIAEKNGVEIIQRSNRQEEKIDDVLIKISAQINTRCNMEQFVQLLTDIENYEKFLTVDTLNIRMSNRGRARNQQNSNNTDITPILTVSGYILTDEVEPEESVPDENS